MITDRPDSLPQWNQQAAGSVNPPRGLLHELIQEGVIAKDLVMPTGTFRVQTRIHCDEKVCLFRNAISCNGVEIQEAPWGPTFQNLAQEMEGRERDPASRREIARRALETHLTVCARVDQALEHKGYLVPPPGPSRAPKLVAVALILVGGLVAGWFYWWPEPQRPAVVTETSASELATTSEDLVEALEAGRSELSEAEPTTLEPWTSADATDPGSREPDPAATPSKVPKAPPPTATPAPAHLKKPAPPSKAPTEDQADAPASPPQPEPPTEPPTGEPSKETRWPVTATLSPNDYFTPELTTGAKLYLEDDVRLTTIPSTYRGIRCVTTQSASGDTKQGVVLSLSEPSEVFVAYDEDVKRRPDWLSSFLQTGDELRAIATGPATETVTFLLFRKEFSAGTVSLGANTGASPMGRISNKVRGKGTFMYLVCVPRAGEPN